MTQVIVMQRQTSDQSSVLVGSEAKNPLPASSKRNWEDIAGLSWLIIEDQDKYDNDTIKKNNEP